MRVQIACSAPDRFGARDMLGAMRWCWLLVAGLGCGRVAFDDRSTTTWTFGERPTATAQGVTIDTTLSSESWSSNFGASPQLSISSARDSDLSLLDESSERHALLRFDTSAIPPRSHVMSASLELVIVDQPTIIRCTVETRSLTERWSEGGGDGVAGTPNWACSTGRSGSCRRPRRLSG